MKYPISMHVIHGCAPKINRTGMNCLNAIVRFIWNMSTFLGCPPWTELPQFPWAQFLMLKLSECKPWRLRTLYLSLADTCSSWCGPLRRSFVAHGWARRCSCPWARRRVLISLWADRCAINKMQWQDRSVIPPDIIYFLRKSFNFRGARRLTFTNQTDERDWTAWRLLWIDDAWKKSSRLCCVPGNQRMAFGFV